MPTIPPKPRELGHLLLPFNAIAPSQRSKVGGKGASLAQMHQAGLPVPPGFVITTETYLAFHDTLVPPAAVHDIYAAFDQLGATTVAVRSSAIAEDAVGSSFAGQFESVLNVTKDQLIRAIQACWNSAGSTKVHEYARINNIAEADLALGVVVQTMVDSEVSGVAFTLNPVTGQTDQIMIEAGFGLGEMLVQGLMTPDNVVVQKRPLKILSTNRYRQAHKMAYHNGETSTLPVIEPDAPKLTSEQYLELAQLALKTANYFGTPQDIEWAHAKGLFYIVQSRPITT